MRSVLTITYDQDPKGRDLPVLAVSKLVQAHGRNKCVTIVKTLSGVDAVEMYKALATNDGLKDDDTFVVLRVDSIINDEVVPYNDLFIRKNNIDADKLIARYKAKTTNHDVDLNYQSEVMTVSQLKAFLTYNEFKELQLTGQLGKM